ncbi:hypothetical protein [Microbispora sp. CA-102843]|uniref:hypothetical protein n=1 Tax=Microbispora sp. CA-102843 TaxID=3239952 RepID=UPI003D917BE9
MSDRDKQATAARALLDLLTHELPQASWTVNDSLSAGELDGQIPTYTGTPGERIEMLRQWATALNSAVIPEFETDREFLKVTSEHMGVQVTVWTHVSLERGERR